MRITIRTDRSDVIRTIPPGHPLNRSMQEVKERYFVNHAGDVIVDDARGRRPARARFGERGYALRSTVGKLPELIRSEHRLAASDEYRRRNDLNLFSGLLRRL